MAPFVLNEQQRDVVEASSSFRRVVVAGAGQGKTEVVAARVAYLVGEEDLSPSDEILVLSFSRAAVEAVRRRVSDRGTPEVSVRTFDSFASRLLLSTTDGATVSGSFDTRIKNAVDAIRAGLVDDDLEDIRHLIVDEVQDLVGDRAELVLAIIERLDAEAGFTALGDPLQGIYGFTTTAADWATRPDRLFDELVSGHGAVKSELGPTYRARGRWPKSVVDLGIELRREQSAQKSEITVANFIDRLTALDLDDVVEFGRNARSSAAILCWTNADALRVSSALHEQRISHQLRRKSEEVGASSWIAAVLSGTGGLSAHRDEVEAFIGRAGEGLDPEETWYLLKGIDGDRRNVDQLNLRQLRILVASRALPLALTGQPRSNVVVSTVHRAKGLEFDQVVVVDPTYERPDSPLEARIRERYVALSRARDDIYRAELPKLFGYFDRSRGHRLVERVFAGKRAKAAEFGYLDVDARLPGSVRAGDEKKIQAALSDSGIVGGNVTGWLDRESSSRQCPTYSLTVESGAFIGATSEKFGRDFGQIFGTRRAATEWPASINGLSVAAVETTAGDPELTRDAGLGSSGFWLVPRVVGLMRPDWGPRKDNE